MALATVVTFGSGTVIEALARALAEGAALHGTEVTTHHLDAVGDPLPADLIDDLADSVGVALGSSLPPAETAAQMTALHRLAHPAIDRAPQAPFRVATTFTSLASDDPAAGETVDAMNRLLYRWGAVIVSPGYPGGPAVHWLDDRPSGDRRLDEALDAAARQGQRLATLVAMIGGAVSRLEKLQL